VRDREPSLHPSFPKGHTNCGGKPHKGEGEREREREAKKSTVGKKSVYMFEMVKV
jgi:hypothetical protein